MKFFLLFSLSAFVSIATPNVANAQTVEIEPYSQLVSRGFSDPYKSSVEIYNEQGLIQARVMKTLEELQKAPVGNPHAFEQRMHSTIRLIGWLGIKPAIGQLVSILDFELDSATVGIASSPQGFEYYPAAQAFARIADKQAINGLFQQMRYEKSDKLLRIYAWILTEVEGQKLALLHVQSELDTESQFLTRLEIQDSNFKLNLQRVKELLATNSPATLVLVPKEKAAPVLSETRG